MSCSVPGRDKRAELVEVVMKPGDTAILVYRREGQELLFQIVGVEETGSGKEMKPLAYIRLDRARLDEVIVNMTKIRDEIHQAAALDQSARVAAPTMGTEDGASVE